VLREQAAVNKPKNQAQESPAKQTEEGSFPFQITSSTVMQKRVPVLCVLSGRAEQRRQRS